MSSSISSFSWLLDQENAFVNCSWCEVFEFELNSFVIASHTWICPDVRGEGPEAREAHSATLVDKCLFIFGGCGKSSGSDDEVFYNDLYILNTGILLFKSLLANPSKLIWNLIERCYNEPFMLLTPCVCSFL